MGFLHPSFLAGLGALALPLLFHLLRRSQVREEAFPTLRFFRLIQKRSTFLFRVGHLLLLLLRLSILVLITLLFAQPFFTSPQLRSLNSGPRTVVVLFDNSASTGARMPPRAIRSPDDTPAPATVHDALRAQLMPELTPVDARDRLVLIALSPRAQRAYSGPLEDFLPEYLPPVTAAGADWIGGLAEAQAALTERDISDPQLVLASDFQAGDPWSSGELEFPKASIHVVRPAPLPQVNAGLVEVREQGAAAVAGRPFEIRAKVHRGLLLRPGSGLTLELVQEPGTAREVVLWKEAVPEVPMATMTATVTLERPGPTRLLLRLEGRDDALDIDDQVELFVDVGEPRRILAINGDPRPAQLYDELFYLRKAAEAAELSVDELEDMADLQYRDPRAYAAIHVANVADPTPARPFLEKVLEGQGAVVLWLGDKVQAETWAGLLEEVASVELYGRASQAQGAPWSYGAPSIRLQAMKGLEASKFWRGLSSRSYWFLRSLPGFDPATVLARHEDETPAVMVLSVGRGAVVLVNAGADLEDSDLPMHPVYPAIIRRSTLLADRPLPRYQAGELVRIPVQNARQADNLLAITPDGRQVPIRPELSGEALSGVLRDTLVPGIYRLVEGTGSGSSERRFQVRPAPEESVLRPMDSSALEEALPARAAHDGDTGASSGGGLRLRDLLLLALGLVLLAEAYVVGYLEAPREGPAAPR